MIKYIFIIILLFEESFASDYFSTDENLQSHTQAIQRNSQINRDDLFENSAHPHSIENTDPEQYKRNQPLVSTGIDNHLEVNPLLQKSLDALLEMNDLSYAIVKEHDKKSAAYIQKFRDEGWRIKTFSGKNGIKLSHDDTPGFIAYNAKLNMITVVYHGSSNSEDWENNLDAKKTLAKDLGLMMPGKVHRGIALKYQSSREDMENTLDFFINSLSPEKKSDVKIVVTGHSQGGSLASLAIADLAANYGRRTFGEHFNNITSNTFFGYFLAPARVYGDDTSFNWLNSHVGQNNMIRHNVKHDPVLNIVLGRTGESFFKKIPFVGDYLADKYAGYKSVGFLALDNTSDAIERGKLLKGVSNKKASSGFLSRIKQSVYSWFAPLHGGSIREDPDAAYDPLIINKNLSDLLDAGKDYKDKSTEIKKIGGIKGLWATLKHKLF